MTVKEKLAALKKYCTEHICTNCPLGKMCWAADKRSTPLTPDITDDKISIMYSTLLQYMNGGSTMKNTTINVAQREAKTIEIGLGEYRLFIAKTYLLDKITDYVTHCGDYINDDVVRALLGVEKLAANLEREGD